MSASAPTPTAALAEWCTSITPDEIPEAIRERAAHLLLDAIASALAGRHGDVPPRSCSMTESAGSLSSGSSESPIRCSMRSPAIASGSPPTATSPRPEPGVTVVTVDGRQLSVRRDVPKGDSADPLSAAEISAKFDKAATGILPTARARRSLRQLLEIHEVSDAAEILPLLRARR